MQKVLDNKQKAMLRVRNNEKHHTISSFKVSVIGQSISNILATMKATTQATMKATTRVAARVVNI